MIGGVSRRRGGICSSQACSSVGKLGWGRARARAMLRRGERGEWCAAYGVRARSTRAYRMAACRGRERVWRGGEANSLGPRRWAGLAQARVCCSLPPSHPTTLIAFGALGTSINLRFQAACCPLASSIHLLTMEQARPMRVRQISAPPAHTRHTLPAPPIAIDALCVHRHNMHNADGRTATQTRARQSASSAPCPSRCAGSRRAP